MLSAAHLWLEVDPLIVLGGVTETPVVHTGHQRRIESHLLISEGEEIAALRTTDGMPTVDIPSVTLKMIR